MNYNYSEFKQQIISDLKSCIGSDIHIQLQSILKNNNTQLDGITLLSDSLNISPTIYLNHYFKQYENGRSLSEIEADILSTYHTYRPTESIDISFFTDYDKVRSHIVFKLINYDYNRKLLQDVPHYRILDLALVFYCLIEVSPAGSAAILIHEQHLSYWNITHDNLYALALQNTPRLLSYELRNMSDVLHELFTAEQLAAEMPGDDSSDNPMYILTNHSKINGSCCILYPNLLQEIAAQLESDLYILPSSIHEVLILPVKNQQNPDELIHIIKEVNSNQLSLEEILSDHLYLFSRKNGQLTIQQAVRG